MNNKADGAGEELQRAVIRQPREYLRTRMAYGREFELIGFHRPSLSILHRHPHAPMRQTRIGVFGDPDFDQGLPGHPQPFGFLIQLANHPGREVNIHPFLFLPGPHGGLDVKMFNDALSGIEFLVEFFSFHITRSPLFWSGDRKGWRGARLKFLRPFS
jgi:hypothetical protein